MKPWLKAPTGKRLIRSITSISLRSSKPPGLLPGEQEELEKEQEMLSNAGEIKEALTAASTALSGDDVSALSMLRMARNNLSRISSWLPEAGDLEKRLESSLVDLNDISYETEKAQ